MTDPPKHYRENPTDIVPSSVGLYVQLLRRCEVWGGQVLAGGLSDRDGLVGHYIEGRHRGAPRLLPAQGLGTGREGEGQAEVEVGAGQVPVFTGGVALPILPRSVERALPLQAGFGVWSRRVRGQNEHT